MSGQCDNTTAVTYINIMGGIKPDKYNNTAFSKWEFCFKEKLWVSATYIPGSYNQEGDAEFRVLQDVTKWKLNSKLFHKIITEFWKPDIDLFASIITRQSDKYVLWCPEPESMAIDFLTYLVQLLLLHVPSFQSHREISSQSISR